MSPPVVQPNATPAIHVLISEILRVSIARLLPIAGRGAGGGPAGASPTRSFTCSGHATRHVVPKRRVDIRDPTEAHGRKRAGAANAWPAESSAPACSDRLGCALPVSRPAGLEGAP